MPEKTADSGAQSDHGHVWNATSSAQPLLSKGGNIGVIFADDTRS